MIKLPPNGPEISDQLQFDILFLTIPLALLRYPCLCGDSRPNVLATERPGGHAAQLGAGNQPPVRKN